MKEHKEGKSTDWDNIYHHTSIQRRAISLLSSLQQKQA